MKKLNDLSYRMPNFQIEAVGTFAGVQNFAIRGQGINSSIPSVDPTVGVFVDGVFLGTTYGVVLDTFDLESVEVLRGPQGLLFGCNVNRFSPGDSWLVSLYGKNLSDAANWGNLTSIAGLWTAGPVQKGRLLGMEVNWRY